MLFYFRTANQNGNVPLLSMEFNIQIQQLQKQANGKNHHKYVHSKTTSFHDIIYTIFNT